jgi:hypothetical protein
MHRPSTCQALLAAVALACLPSDPARAQVRRCTAADGSAIYTDRNCAELGAKPAPPVAPGTDGVRMYRGGCARNLPDLVYQMTSAIDAQDVNRLASVYHWTGVSARGAVTLMARLEAITRRPLVDIVPVVPQADDPVAAYARPRRAPVALRVEQTLANGTTPSRTVFGLQQHYGCWWIRL